MRGLGATDPDVAARVRQTTRRAFETLVDRALSENVAFVVVAGDLFDGDWDDSTTALWTIRQFRRLEARRVPVLIALGNHDRQNKTLRNLKSLAWPPNVVFFSDKKAETFVYPDDLPKLFAPKTKNRDETQFSETPERVAIIGRSYSGPTCPENLAATYPDATPNAFNVGVLHTELGGDGAKSTYAPTGIETLNAKRYQYWALGHVHQRRTEQISPSWIGYSGVLQGRHIRETEPKGFYLVEIENGATVRPEPTFVPADSLRWFAVEIDLSDAATEDDFQTKFVDAAQKTVDDADGRFAAVRISLVGRTPLHRELAKRRADGTLGETLRGWASDRADEIWLEEVELKTAPPRPATLGTVGLLGDLAAEFDRKIARLTAEIERGADASETQNADAPPPSFSGTLFAELEPPPTAAPREEPEDAALLDDLRKRVGPFLAELGIDLSDPATLRRWNEEAREILTEAFADAEN